MSKVGDPLPGDSKCVWEWLGVMPWEPVSDDCPEGMSCSPPAAPGSLIGEKETTLCELDD